MTFKFDLDGDNPEEIAQIMVVLVHKLKPFSGMSSHRTVSIFTEAECFFALFQVASEFILESERESFIEQVREVIEMADEKGEGMNEGFPQVFLLIRLTIRMTVRTTFDPHRLSLTLTTYI